MIEIKLSKNDPVEPNTNAACPLCGSRLISDDEYIWCSTTNREKKFKYRDVKSIGCSFGVIDLVTVDEYLRNGFIRYRV